MALFRRSEKREVVSLNDPSFSNILGITADGNKSDKATEATVYSCLRILSEAVSKLPLKLYQEANDGITKATEHYLYTLLKLRPNPLMSSSTFWKVVEFNRNYYGHSVVYIETERTGKVKALYPLDMNNVEIWIDDKGIIGQENAIWYIYKTAKGEIKIKHNEVLHFMGMTKNGIQGMAIKDYLSTLVESAQSGSNFINKFYKQGLFSSAILSYTGDISQEAERAMVDRFERMAAGVQNAHKILPLPLGFDMKTMNTSMADAQFLEINRLTIQQIAAAFGVKMGSLNQLDNSTYANIESQQREFYVETLQSTLTGLEQELTYKLLTSLEVQKGFFFKFNVDSMLRADIKTRYEAYNLGLSGGFLTANEIRQKEDMPIVAGGDELIVNGSMVNLQNVGAAYNDKLPSPKGGDVDGEE